MIKKRICALVSAAVMLFGVTDIPTMAEAASGDLIIPVNDTFNDCITNETPEDWTYTGMTAMVKETDSTNKALMVQGTAAQSEMRKTVGEFGDYYVMSVDVNYTGAAPNLSIGLGTGKNPGTPITVVDGEIKTYDGKTIGSLHSNKFTTITMVVSKGQIYDIYIDGTCMVSKWKMPSGVTSGDVVFQISNGFGKESTIYFDNIRMYQAKRIYKCIPNAAMNPEKVDRFNIDDDPGDYLYFDSHDMNTSADKYENFVAYPKTNTLVCGRYDYTNPDRDESIYLKKATTDDVFFNIYTEKHSFMHSEKKYTNFLFEGDFQITDLTKTTAYILMRDTSSGSSNQESVAMRINSDGSVKLSDNQRKSLYTKNKWFHIAMAIDLANHNIDVYVDGELLAEDVAINENIKTLNFIRFCIDIGEGTGEIYVKNLKLTGLVVPYENGIEVKTSQFADETPIKEYLQDKIAFQGYSELLTVGGEKTKIEPAPIMEGDELYVTADTLNKAFGLSLTEQSDSLVGENITIGKDGSVVYNEKKVTLSKQPKEQDGRLYVPVLAFGGEVLGKYTFSHKTGMFLLADDKIALDTEDWEYPCMRPFEAGITPLNDFDQLNSYLSFERPSAAKIQEDFNRATNNGEMHPRILVTQSQFDKIKQARTTDSVLEKFVEQVLAYADTYAAKEVLTYKFDDKMRMLNTAREALYRMQYFGFAWKITGDEKYAERAWQDLDALSKFPDFNTSHIIDSGEFNMALAIGYDWLYDYLSDEQKKIVSDTILNNSLKDLADVYYSRVASTSSGSQHSISAKWVSNYNAVINGGAINAALAVAELDPEYCFDVIEKGLRSIEYTTFGFAPGGGWSEGIGYWNYTWQYLCYAMTSVENSMGTDYSVLDYQGLDTSLEYHISMCGPQGINNYHDTGESFTYETNVNYSPMSKLFDDPNAFALRKNHLYKAGRLPDVVDLIFYNFDVTEDDMTDLPKAIKTDGTESFSFRETYDWTAGGMYASAHFGATGGYHSQNDTGTFVYDVLGKRWAMDLGMEDYNLTNELGISLEKTYRRRAEGHNICVINPGASYNQIYGKFSKITDFKSNEYGGYVIADMDGIYADADTMKSGYYVGDNMRSLTVRHEIDLNRKSTVYWFMHTRADITIGENNEIILSQGTESVNVRYATNAQNVEVSVMDAKPLPTSPNPPEQNQNEGIHKIAIKMETSGHLDLTVKLAPMGEPASVTPLLDVPMSEWQLPEKSEFEADPDLNLNFTVMSDGTEINGPLPWPKDGPMPDIQVVAEDPNAVVEIQQGQSPDETTVIKVSDSTGLYYKISKINYVEISGKDISQFDQLPIEGVEVSSEPEPANNKANMLDGSFVTRWTCMAKGETAVFDLGEVKDIDGIAVAFWKGNVRQYFFDILVSEDGKNYQSVVKDGESSGSSEQLEVFDFDTVKARYVKFIGYGNTETNATGVNSNVLEFRVLKNKFM